MSPSGEEELSEVIISLAAFVLLPLPLRLSGSSSFRFFPDLTGTLPLAVTNPDQILVALILSSFFFFLSMICQGASVTAGRRGIGSLTDHFKAGYVSRSEEHTS